MSTDSIPADPKDSTTILVNTSQNFLQQPWDYLSFHKQPDTQETSRQGERTPVPAKYALGSVLKSALHNNTPVLPQEKHFKHTQTHMPPEVHRDAHKASGAQPLGCEHRCSPPAAGMQAAHPSATSAHAGGPRPTLACRSSGQPGWTAPHTAAQRGGPQTEPNHRPLRPGNPEPTHWGGSWGHDSGSLHLLGKGVKLLTGARGGRA